MSDETGDVVSVDDVVACADDPLLPDAVRVGGWLSVFGVTLVCDSEVARIGRGDTGVVVCTRSGSTCLGGRAHLPSRFPAARATTDERIVVAS